MVNCKFSNIECLEESCAICSSANRLWFQNISRYGGVPCFPSRNPGTLPYFSVDARNNSPPPRPTRDSSLFPKPLVQVQCGAKGGKLLGLLAPPNGSRIGVPSVAFLSYPTLEVEIPHIRVAVREITDGQAGRVTARNLAGWKGEMEISGG